MLNGRCSTLMFAGAQPRRNNVVAHFLSVIDWTQVQRPLAALF
jgi:hypothetical protein